MEGTFELKNFGRNEKPQNNRNKPNRLFQSGHHMVVNLVFRLLDEALQPTNHKS